MWTPTPPDEEGPRDPASTEPSLQEVLGSYAAAGFTSDAYVNEAGMLECGSCNASSDPARVEVHSIRRLEGASDPADLSAVLAAICPACHALATAVIRFGPEASAGEQRVWEMMRDRRDSSLLPGDATPSEDVSNVGPTR